MCASRGLSSRGDSGGQIDRLDSHGGERQLLEEKQMPEFTSYDAGTPSWVDHATKDLETFNAFYGALFGWEADDQGEEMGHYTLMRKGGKTVAGNTSVMTEGQPSAWVT
jgi:hypothetical protein